MAAWSAIRSASGPQVTEENARSKRLAARYGYRRVHVLLRREGWQVGRNVIYRLYREEGLALRTKRPRRRKMAVARQARPMPRAANQAWPIDFVRDQLVDGTKFRALTVVDVFAACGAALRVTREALAIGVGQRLKGENVVGVLNRLARHRGAPRKLFADNGSEGPWHTSSPAGWSICGPIIVGSSSTARPSGRISQGKASPNNGGGTGIRTLETVSRLHTFQACAFDHSATPPISAAI